MRERVIRLQIIEKSVESSRSSPETGAGEGRFDASHKHQPVTESSYINSLANRTYRSTVKTLPATLPEPWTTVRGPRSKHIGPWSTDLEPRILDRGSRLKLRGSRLGDAGSGVTAADCRIRIDLVRGVGRVLAELAALTLGG